MSEDARDFNPRWKGYIYIVVASLVNFASIANLEVDDNQEFDGMFQVSIIFGIATFSLASAILVLDRFQYCCDKETADKFNFINALDGKVEGYTLLAFNLWWIVGVAHITQVNGVAYVATNIYFSSWLTLFACVYTLDKWSAAKDILSIQELTGLSATLASWYVLFVGSMVAMGTSCDLHMHLAEKHKASAAYGIALGLVSALVALFFIMVHYRLVDFQWLQVGGWIELSASFFGILIWIIGVSILTSEGGIAATIGGSGCTTKAEVKYNINPIDSCYVVWVDSEEEASSDQPTTPVAPITTTKAPVTSSGPTDAPTQKPKTTTAPTSSQSEAKEDSSGELTEAPDPDAPPTEEELEEFFPSLTINASTLFNETNATDEIVDGAFEILDGTFDVDDEEEEFETIENEILAGWDDNAAAASNHTLLNQTLLNHTLANHTLLNYTLVNSTTSNNALVLELANATFVENDSERRLQDNITINATTEGDIAGAAAGVESEVAGLELPTRAPLFTAEPSQAPLPCDQIVEHYSCETILDMQIPGSNLYLASWVCFVAAFNITLRWKAAQAIQFAQAQTRKADEKAGLSEKDRELGSEREVDDGDVDDRDHGDDLE